MVKGNKRKNGDPEECTSMYVFVLLISNGQNIQSILYMIRDWDIHAAINALHRLNNASIEPAQ